jgi:ubiquinone/menaquinone biosynthesis C-methylase UbiE
VADVREQWREGRVIAALYDEIVERERLARIFGALLWGTDTRRLFRQIALLGEVPDGSEILDVPCGGGLALRGLRPEQAVRYVGADLSPVMLARARSQAERRGLGQVELVEADVESLPFGDGEFQLCITYNSLHCFPDPAAALAEMVRVLRPGGILRGTTVVRGTGRRHDAVIRAMQRGGAFGPGGTEAEFRRWLAQAGLAEVEVSRDGAIAHLSGLRPSG